MIFFRLRGLQSLPSFCRFNSTFVAPKRRSTPPSPYQTDEALKVLVEQRKYAYAYRVYLQLHFDGIPIAHRSIYLKPALAQLSDLSPSYPDIFYAWISLLPSRHLMPNERLYPNPFGHEHFKAIYTSGYPAEMIPIAHRFAETASSKGYFTTVFDQFVAFATRFVTPSNGAAMVRDLLDAATRYEKDRERHYLVAGPEEDSDNATQKRIENMRSIAAKVCRATGWHAEMGTD
ncbi:hypothetical protein AAF712_000563 [Marasmius tenuissimus]|uniref:Uncharacterized protein n=1 Tax=Marasmius tenuissimus TaxID=585030 RepID=A0ABR3AGW0_9AGAR